MADMNRIGRWYAALNPDSLPVTDEDGQLRSYVAFDAWTYNGEEQALRGPSAAEALVDDIALAAVGPNPSGAQLFGGFRGTGAFWYDAHPLVRHQLAPPAEGEAR